MKTVLSIAGSDSCGGAGIQADIKTMTMNGVYGMCAITALTAQNTTGVRGIQEASTKCLQQQLEAVFEDIFPDAVKIGMVFCRIDSSHCRKFKILSGKKYRSRSGYGCYERFCAAEETCSINIVPGTVAVGDTGNTKYSRSRNII